ncbi:MAG: hypothetical protein QM726_14930 [Chitinophagaceae bacterium]
MKKILIVVAFSLVAFAIQAQNNTNTQQSSRPLDKKAEKRQRINALLKLEEEGDPAFKKQNIFGIKLATDGYGLSFEKGKYKTPRRTLLYQFELNEKKHPKEEKLTGQDFSTGQLTSLIWGKAINFYQFKLGIGQQYLIGGKANKSGVAVSAIYAGGVSVGMAKPYLLNVTKQNQTSARVPWDSIYANPSAYNSIQGASGFTYGWNQLKIKPGLHAKLAMRFDYGRFNETVTAIETGINAEYYFNKIHQMVELPDKNFFFNAYVTILFGRRK